MVPGEDMRALTKNKLKKVFVMSNCFSIPFFCFNFFDNRYA